MRRKENEVIGLDNILTILDKCEVIRIGLCEDNKPYIVPMNFGYEEKDGRVFIYLHGASAGRKMDIISQNNAVCFEADCSFKTMPANSACNYSAKYESVIGEGIIEILSGIEKSAGLDIIMKKYGFAGQPVYSDKALSAVSVMRITAASISGKAR